MKYGDIVRHRRVPDDVLIVPAIVRGVVPGLKESCAARVGDLSDQ